MNNDWQGKRVLVTGADGFIGSHLVERLVRDGARVRAFVYYNSFGRWGWIDNDLAPEVRQEIEVVPGDIRDANLVREAVTGNEIIFHISSLIAIPYSYHAPDSYVQTNISGALNILNAARSAGVARLVHTSTSEVYGSAQYVPIDERHPLQGQSPYSATKAGADLLVESFHRSFGLPVVTVRPFNTYGPRQSARAVIPDIISQLLRGAQHITMGSLTPTRDFNYVADTVSGFLALAQCDRAIGHVVNVGSGREISVGDLVKIIMRIIGREVPVICTDERLRPEKSEVSRLCCDATRAREWAGWQPRYSLEDGLTETTAWIRENMQYFKPEVYSL